MNMVDIVNSKVIEINETVRANIILALTVDKGRIVAISFKYVTFVDCL